MNKKSIEMRFIGASILKDNLTSIVGLILFLLGFIKFINIVFNPNTFIGCISYIFIGVSIVFMYSDIIKIYIYHAFIPKSIKSLIFER